ncbi:MAG: hypothetical protein C0623_02400 [Desulfuromonas sp.]|nr:MAG: hypothetical protein C0623_02400 [Desulfuromonas sp.]
MSSIRLFAIALSLFIVSGCVSSSGNGSTRLSAESSLEVSLSPFYLVNHSATNSDHAWHLTRVVSAGEPIAGFLKPNQMLRDAFAESIFSLKLAPQKLSSGDSSHSFSDACGGGYTTEIKVAADGNFVGAIIFSGFADDCSLALTGRVPFKGSLNQETGNLETELTLSQLKGALGTSSWTLGGELSLSFNAYKGTSQVFSGESEVSLADETGDRCRLDDVAFRWDHTGVYQTVILNGRIHFANLGSVRIETTSPLEISNTPGRAHSVSRGTPPANHKRRLPFNGALLFHGANNSNVRLLFSKPGFPGFFWIDGPNGLQTMGTL